MGSADVASFRNVFIYNILNATKTAKEITPVTVFIVQSSFASITYGVVASRG